VLISYSAGSDPEFEKGGGPSNEKVTSVALPGSDPGYGVVDKLCSYFSDKRSVDFRADVYLQLAPISALTSFPSLVVRDGS
jgi:hypothetical protein